MFKLRILHHSSPAKYKPHQRKRQLRSYNRDQEVVGPYNYPGLSGIKNYLTEELLSFVCLIKEIVDVFQLSDEFQTFYACTLGVWQLCFFFFLKLNEPVFKISSYCTN